MFYEKIVKDKCKRIMDLYFVKEAHEIITSRKITNHDEDNDGYRDGQKVIKMIAVVIAVSG